MNKSSFCLDIRLWILLLSWSYFPSRLRPSLRILPASGPTTPLARQGSLPLNFLLLFHLLMIFDKFLNIALHVVLLKGLRFGGGRDSSHVACLDW